MKTALEEIVNAVLYEGYILYPYHPLTKKNQRAHFTFGCVYPQIYSEKENGVEPCVMQTECLLQTKSIEPKLKVTLGFLQPMKQEIAKSDNGLQLAGSLFSGIFPDKIPTTPFQSVPQLEVNGKIFQSWTEAVERKISVELENFFVPRKIPFKFAARRNCEPICNENGNVAGLIFRRLELLEGEIKINAERLKNDLLKISVRVVNRSPVAFSDLEIPENILQRIFASTHFILETGDGKFISSLETPDEFKAFAGNCKNIGCRPVLIGDENLQERDTILASPIILYDYPKIATESIGEFFDGTEIDKMPTLRVLTMTDEEKREMSVGDFSRRILERANSITTKDFLKLHGVLRGNSESNRHRTSNTQHSTEVAA